MSATATERPAAIPAEERRGGEAPDWAQARPGEELPGQRIPPVAPGPEQDQDDCGILDRDIAPLPHACGHPSCGGD